MLSYAAFVVFAGGAAVRDASGNVLDLWNSTSNRSVYDCVHTEHGCQFGLHNSYTVSSFILYKTWFFFK